MKGKIDYFFIETSSRFTRNLPGMKPKFLTGIYVSIGIFRNKSLVHVRKSLVIPRTIFIIINVQISNWSKIDIDLSPLAQYDIQYSCQN